MRPGAIVQVRMSSQRLPGKALADLVGQPLLERVLARVRRARSLAFVGVATSDRPEDDAIERYCRARAIPCTRGPLDDVLGRILAAARLWRLDPVVRITGDCPFVSPELIDEFVGRMLAERLDATGLAGTTWHEGIDPFSQRALAHWDGLSLQKEEREHLALLPRSRAGSLRIARREVRPEERARGGRKLSVDRPEDLIFARAIYSAFDGRDDFSTAELVRYLEEGPRERTGAHLLAEALVEGGIPRLHLYPGGTIMPTLNAWIERGGSYVVARHEQGAGYAALAEARLSGEPRAVLVTSGPGVTNLMTVIADAWYDATPLLAITGQVGTADLASRPGVRQRGFQEVPTPALCGPIAKACLRPSRAGEIPALVREALDLAVEGRPGPVVIELPMDLQRAVAEEEPPRPAPRRARTLDPGPRAVPRSALERVELLAGWLREAERPVCLAGQGVLQAGAMELLRRLAEREQIPVATSLLGVGSFPSRHALSLGYCGHTGTGWANRAIHECDLLLVLGARLDVRQTGSLPERFAAGARIARVDLDPDELAEPRVQAELALHADVGEVLMRLEAALTAHRTPPPDREPWQLAIKGWREELPLDAYPAGDGCHPAELLRALARATEGEELVVVTGVGHHQQWAARHLDFDAPRRVLLSSGGHGAMGYDLPSAVGACLARPGARVLCVVGDGSLQINLQELGTLAEYQLPAKIVLLDNRRLAMVSQFQKLTWGHDPSTGDRAALDFAALARAYGLPCHRIEREDAALISTLRAFLDEPGPALLWVRVDPACEVSPMLLGGQTLDAMWSWSGS